MKAICNTSPLIGHLELLWELFDIYIPQEVYNEIVNVASEQAIGKHEVRNAVDKGFIKIHEVRDQDFIEKSYGRLHKGELEVIVGAKEIGASIVIIDEKSARNFAETLMLKPLGLLGVLKLAKQKEKINEIEPLIDLLVSNRFRISDKIKNQLLKEVGEK